MVKSPVHCFLIFAIMSLSLGLSTSALAQDSMPFNFPDAELSEIIAQYSKATGQAFNFDANVRGKATILNPQPISKEEAFNQLADVLALNGLAWIRKDKVILVQQARKVIRNSIAVVKELPPLRPQNMVTWVYECKNVSAEQIYRELRILQSNDGELNPMGNKLVFSDWISNLHRVAKVLEVIDQPTNPKTAKIVQEYRAQLKAEEKKEPRSRPHLGGEGGGDNSPRPEAPHPKAPPPQPPQSK